jgi:hypothetical protein
VTILATGIEDYDLRGFQILVCQNRLGGINAPGVRGM